MNCRLFPDELLNKEIFNPDINLCSPTSANLHKAYMHDIVKTFHCRSSFNVRPGLAGTSSEHPVKGECNIHPYDFIETSERDRLNCSGRSAVERSGEMCMPKREPIPPWYSPEFKVLIARANNYADRT